MFLLVQTLETANKVYFVDFSGEWNDEGGGGSLVDRWWNLQNNWKQTDRRFLRRNNCGLCSTDFEHATNLFLFIYLFFFFIFIGRFLYTFSLFFFFFFYAENVVCFCLPPINYIWCFRLCVFSVSAKLNTKFMLRVLFFSFPNARGILCHWCAYTYVLVLYVYENSYKIAWIRIRYPHNHKHFPLTCHTSSTSNAMSVKKNLATDISLKAGYLLAIVYFLAKPFVF